MKSMQVFDKSIMQCNSGRCGCGGNVDQHLIDFVADIDWATQNGAHIERFNLEQQSIAFTNNHIVKDFINRCGEEMLPLILVDDELTLAGRYPNRLELSKWLEIAQPTAETKKIDECCSGGRCG